MVSEKTDEVTVLLHGFTGSSESWRWIEGHAIDLPGHRRERVAPPLSSWDAVVESLALDILPFAPCAIAGYSLGARLALGLLIARPKMFTRAMLIGVSPGLASEGERIVRRASDEAWATMIEEKGVSEFADAWELQPSLRVVSKVPNERLDLARAVRREHTPAGLAWCLRTIGLSSMPDLFPCLRKIQQTVTLVVGGEDVKFRAIAERMLPELEEGRLTVVPGAGHNVVLERPDVIRSFSKLR